MSPASMSSSACPRCGAPVPAAVGECPRCLLQLGLHLVPRDPEPNVAPTGSRASAAGDARDPGPEGLAAAFPGLEIERELGRGGMGVVYLARQRKLDRLVALKVLSPELSGDPDFAERFLREARALGRLSHENIVAVHDFGETDGLCWLMMEHVDGVDLRRAMETGELTPESALAIVPQVCAALACAHEQGIVHRDIKPENVLLDREGKAKIADFGLAKLIDPEARAETLTQAAVAMGTPHYMAPEQMKGARDVDHRADIFSLGVVFYEMLTGQLPIGRFEPPSRRVQVDVRLDEIVLRALESEPERRYQSAVEVKSAVERVGSSARPVRPDRFRAARGERSQQNRLRRSRVFGGVITLLVLITPALAAGLWNLGWSGLALVVALVLGVGLVTFHAAVVLRREVPRLDGLPRWAVLDRMSGAFLLAVLGVGLLGAGVVARWERATRHYKPGERVRTEGAWSELVARERLRLFDRFGLDEPLDLAPPTLVSSGQELVFSALPAWLLLAGGVVVVAGAALLLSRLWRFESSKERLLAAAGTAALVGATVVFAGLGRELSPFAPRVDAKSPVAGITTFELGSEAAASALREQLGLLGWEVTSLRIEEWRDEATLDALFHHVELDARPASLFDRWSLSWRGPRRVLPELHLEVTGLTNGQECGLSWDAGWLANDAFERGRWQLEVSELLEATRSLASGS